MTSVRFLGGPWHAERRKISGNIRPMILVESGPGQPRTAAYVYYSPTGDYVIASYLNPKQAA